MFYSDRGAARAWAGPYLYRQAVGGRGAYGGE